jgi:hypothetical protein
MTPCPKMPLGLAVVSQGLPGKFDFISRADTQEDSCSTVVWLQHGSTNGGRPLRLVQHLGCSLHSCFEAPPATSSECKPRLTMRDRSQLLYAEQHMLQQHGTAAALWPVAALWCCAHWFEVFGCSEPGTGAGARLGCVSPARLQATCSTRHYLLLEVVCASCLRVLMVMSRSICMGCGEA